MTSPAFFRDRIPVAMLERSYPELLSQMQRQQIGKIDKKATVHFCGLANVGKETSVMFLPKCALSKSPAENLMTAKITMRSLAMFGNESQNRTGISSEDGGNTGLLATILELANDYILNGIYAERVRVPDLNRGKPNWARTVSRQVPMVGGNGNIIYSDIITSRAIDAQDSILAKIQAAVLKELSEHHDWWLDAFKGCDDELLNQQKPTTPKPLWSMQLKSLLPTLYANRAISLARNLIDYLDDTRGQREGTFIFGVEDFHTVWEQMLRKVLPDVSPDWNSRLPKPAYIRSENGSAMVQTRGMQTDIILENEACINIIDAKYYDATSLATTPGWGDTVKQLFYELAIRTVTDKRDIRGTFIFPSQKSGDGYFDKVIITKPNGDLADGFPTIRCYYANIFEVMSVYVSRQKLTINLL